MELIRERFARKVVGLAARTNQTVAATLLDCLPPSAAAVALELGILTPDREFMYVDDVYDWLRHYAVLSINHECVGLVVDGRAVWGSGGRI